VLEARTATCGCRIAGLQCLCPARFRGRRLQAAVTTKGEAIRARTFIVSREVPLGRRIIPARLAQVPRRGTRRAMAMTDQTRVVTPQLREPTIREPMLRFPTTDQPAHVVNSAFPARADIHQRQTGEATPAPATTALPMVAPTVVQDRRLPTMARTADRRRVTAADRTAGRRLPQYRRMTAAPTDALLRRLAEVPMAADPMGAALHHLRQHHRTTAVPTDVALLRTVAAVVTAVEAGRPLVALTAAADPPADTPAAADTPQPPATAPAAVEAVRIATVAATPTADITKSKFMPARRAAFGRRFLGPQWLSSPAGARSDVSTFVASARSGRTGGDWNWPGSFPASAALMNSIQIGNAARAPVSFAPRDFFSSYPTHTPAVNDGEKPTNQASVKSLVVPVFPASGSLSFVAAIPVPCCTTSSSIEVIRRAVRALITSFTSG